MDTALPRTNYKRERSIDSSGSGNPAPHVSPTLPPDSDDNENKDDTDEHDTSIDTEDLHVNTYVVLNDAAGTPLQDQVDTAPEDLEDEYQYCFNTSVPDYTQLANTTAQSLNDDVDWTFPAEIEVDNMMGHWFTHCPRELAPGEVLIFAVSNSSSQVQVVIEREMNDLSKEEINTHWDEVCEAKYEELKRWNDLHTVERLPR